MSFEHIPVLLNPTVESLEIKPDGIYVDGTAGGGGHSEAIAQHLSNDGLLISIDRDPDAIKAAGERLKKYNCSKLVKNVFSNIREVLDEQGVDKVDGILLDIGVSSHQLDTPERGFSFHHDAPLDMRMSQDGESAEDLINSLPEEEIKKILFEYGDEKFAPTIARNIVKAREKQRITTTFQLAEIISYSVPAFAKRDGHPARKSFQAIRIRVNNEIGELEKAIDSCFECLNENGILSIITFHSLEDRIVKNKFKEYTVGCTCPKDFPICVCGKMPRGKVSKPVTADSEELKFNPRSRSAKLRSIKKLH